MTFVALADVARAYYAAQASLAEGAQVTARGLWSELDPADLSGSWLSSRIGLRLFVALSAAQLTAAGMAAAYVAAALFQQGARSAPLGMVEPRSLAGVASDGRDLESLLYQPLIGTLTAIRDGATPLRALEMGGSALATIADTQTSDAGRAAVSVAMTAEPLVTGWVRILVPPSCGRCAVLAGRFYRWSDGFTRHERCDCVHAPAVEDTDDDLRTDPEAYFRSLSESDQDKYFTKAGAQAIRDGADIGQVVNARRGARGLSQPGRLTDAEQKMLKGGRNRGRLERVDVYGRKVAVTSEGVTVRGVAGKRLAAAGTTRDRGARYRRAKTPRLMPEAIADIAGDDREERIRLLRRFGYII